MARKQDFDAVVLCSSVPVVLRKRIARQLKGLKPATPLIVICEPEECNAFKRLAEAVIAPEAASEQTLVEAIRRLVPSEQEQQRKII